MSRWTTSSSTAAGRSTIPAGGTSSTSPATFPARSSSTSSATWRLARRGPDVTRLPDADDFAHAAGQAGIGPDVFVVAYGSLGGAERLWWLLRHFGHDAWCDRARELARTALKRRRARGSRDVRPTAGSDDTIERGALLPRLEELVVVDARLPARYRGEPNPIDRVPGRIPGALNAPWNEPPPPLPDGELVAYCGSGVTACVVLHRLHLAGREGRLYPGSWSEWEQYDELPRERG